MVVHFVLQMILVVQIKRKIFQVGFMIDSGYGIRDTGFQKGNYR